MSCKPLISGALLSMEKSTFVHVENCYHITKEKWIRRLDDMQGIGLNLLFIFAGVNESLWRKAFAAPDLLEFIFSECDRRRMEVIIAASGSDDFSIRGVDLSREMRLVEATTKEVFTRYGSHTSLAGWYLPYECPIAHTPYVEDLLGKLYRTTAEQCKSLTPRLPVAISPFFMLDTKGMGMDFEYVEPAKYIDCWSRILSYAKIDVLALQDNGEHLSCFTEQEKMPFIEAFAQACRNAGTQFWGNVETGEFAVADLDDFVRRFGKKADVNDPNPKIRGNWRAVPIDRLIRKLELISRLSVRNVSWGFFEFYNPAEGDLHRAAYENYKAYYQRTKVKTEE